MPQRQRLEERAVNLCPPTEILTLSVLSIVQEILDDFYLSFVGTAITSKGWTSRPAACWTLNWPHSCSSISRSSLISTDRIFNCVSNSSIVGKLPFSGSGSAFLS